MSFSDEGRPISVGRCPRRSLRIGFGSQSWKVHKGWRGSYTPFGVLIAEMQRWGGDVSPKIAQQDS